ncbi:MAG TPA: phosphatase PAP2 family protein [Acidimicrobiales bacterium]|nr:phosphatase PAP2 family protein [Acidimicrobiales bacterium]
MAYTEQEAWLGSARGGGSAETSVPDRWRVASVASWLARRHSLATEMAVVVAFYLLYDSSRGLVGSGQSAAISHAHMVVSFERDVSLGFERGVQRVAEGVPGLLTVFGWGYMSLHLGATLAALLWLHRRGQERAFATLRTAGLFASGLGLVGFLVFPTAPPRLAIAGVSDAVSHATVNLNSSTLHWLYNPYAAMPSMHIGYATLVGYSLARWGLSGRWRWLGALYPAWVAAEVISTGNHFVLDVLAGALVAAVALAGARLVVGGVPSRSSADRAGSLAPILTGRSTTPAVVIAGGSRAVGAAVDAVELTAAIRLGAFDSIQQLHELGRCVDSLAPAAGPAK